MLDATKELFKRVWTIFWKWILTPLLSIIVGIAIVRPLIDNYVRPESYTIYFVGNFDNDDVNKIWKKFNQEYKDDLEIDGVKIKLRKFDGKETDAKRISEKLAKEHDTLMVIGHLYSTPTQIALPNYLQADPPIPVILAFESNPNVLPPRIPIDTFYPVFRLSPTDDKQAETAADFIISNKGKKIWVVEDASNNVYSSYLASEFIKQIHIKNESSKVILWSMDKEILSFDTVKTLGIDWIFYAGNWSNSLILIHQISEIWKNQTMPSILLSDWNVDKAFLNQEAVNMKKVFFTHTMKAEDYNKEGYGYWGKLAHQLLKQLVQNADEEFDELVSERSGPAYYIRRLVNFRDVADARNALYRVMEKSVNLEKPFDLGEQQYIFRRDGAGIKNLYHVWRVCEHEFVDFPRESWEIHGIEECDPNVSP